MSKLDPILTQITDMDIELLRAQGDLRRNGIVTAGVPAPVVRVLIQFTGALEGLEPLGFQLKAMVGDVAMGEIPVANLARLEEVPCVVWVDASQTLQRELDLSVPEIRANLVHSASTPYKGAGVVVGIIDSGIDYQHACFRKADGTSRILFIWDHDLSPAAGETSPTEPDCGFGVEYTKAQIDAALATANPTSTVRHTDTDTGSFGGHGTHVAGIAAGNGRAAGGSDAAGTFIGVAPEADLIVVNYGTGVDAAGNSIPVGDSIQAIQAFKYVFAKAAALRRPCVINFSQGDNWGPHDGTSVLERGLDDLLGPPGRAIVKSAGNAGEDDIHARGTWTQGTDLDLKLRVPNDTPRNNRIILDLWYSGRDRISLRLIDPAGTQYGLVNDSNGVTNQNLGSSNTARITCRQNDPRNHDNRVFIILSVTGAANVQAGEWTLRITPTTVVDGRFNAWIQRSNRKNARFSSHQTRAGSISVPGTSREVVTVGNYVTRQFNIGSHVSNAVGTRAGSSSCGPSRDGRIKPEIMAPGEWIKSTLSSLATSIDPTDTGPYHKMLGTSMSAPHVTGAIALVFQKYPTLVGSQIRRGLEATARSDASTGTVPNDDYGYGKLDVKALVDRAYPTPITQNWVRMQPRLANWPMTTAPPIFDIYAQESGSAVIELAWDPATLLAPSDRYTGVDAMRYYASDSNFSKTMTNLDRSNRTVTVSAQNLRLSGNRLSWTMPQALWDAYVEEARKAMASPAQSTFQRNLYYRVRVTPTGASEAIIWPADDAIRNNVNAPHMGLLRLTDAPPARQIPDEPAVNAMGGISGRPQAWGALLRQLWNDLPETDPDRMALARIFAHDTFRTELTVQQRGHLLTLWLFAGPASRARLPVLLERRVWTSTTTHVPAAAVLDRLRQRTLTENLLALVHLVPHRDIAGVLTPEQIVDDVLTEVIDPNGRINRGQSYTGAPTSIQAMLINVNPSEYVRLQLGLLSQGGVVNLHNGRNVEVPGGTFQIARYGAPQTDPLYTRTYSELAFQTAVLAYAKGSSFPRVDPSAPPESANGVATVFRATLNTGLSADEIRLILEGLFNVGFRSVFESPSAGLRDRFLAAMRDTRVPVPFILNWPSTTTVGTTGLAMVLGLRYDAGRLFYKNPQYPGSSPPTGAVAGASANQPPRRYDDPSATLESMGDSDLATWLRGYFQPVSSIL